MCSSLQYIPEFQSFKPNQVRLLNFTAKNNGVFDSTISRHRSPSGRIRERKPGAPIQNLFPECSINTLYYSRGDFFQRHQIPLHPRSRDPRDSHPRPQRRRRDPHHYHFITFLHSHLQIHPSPPLGLFLRTP